MIPAEALSGVEFWLVLTVGLTMGWCGRALYAASTTPPPRHARRPADPRGPRPNVRLIPEPSLFDWSREGS